MLAERGLLAALREHAASWVGDLTLRLDLPELLPPLDPAVEAAAYRIAVEGLHNAERHSGGSTVTLRINARDGDIEVHVIDDGQGLVAASTGGVGLGSMRERARLVGGTVALEPGETGGLRVRGVLPAGAP